MNVFALRDRIVQDYEQYVRSFVRARDERLARFIDQELNQGLFWPDPILQVNPAYAQASTVEELAAQGVVRPETARFFRRPDGSSIRLYAHQLQALQLAQLGKSYVVTSGTGSGKSLTYLIPIFDALVREPRDKRGVRALLVYPMNALINSQFEAIQRFQKQYGEPRPLRFEYYTGEVRDREKRQQILDDPPDVLLTNYMMLELLLVRAHERMLVDRATQSLQFMAWDELHTYRGRQGADIAMLIRRLRERSGNPHLLAIGTSATMSRGVEGAEDERLAAELAGDLFGEPFTPEQVVVETLRRNTTGEPPRSVEEWQQVLSEPLPVSQEALRSHPLASWVELNLGIQPQEDGWTRRAPLALSEAVQRLAETAGVDVPTARDRLQEVLVRGSQAAAGAEPVLAFRLHQFLSGGGTVLATWEPTEARYLTVREQTYAPEEADEPGERLLYPLVFCRECGQEFYHVDWLDGEDLMVPALDAEPSGTARRGYLLLADDELGALNDVDNLPAEWVEVRQDHRRVKGAYQSRLPVAVSVTADGHAHRRQPVGTQGWFLPEPLGFCPRCGLVHPPRAAEYQKVTQLSQIGRSTATTLTTIAAVLGQRDGEVDPQAAKVLSFTDNRQDASLQAGHFNDFIQISRIRSALYRALQRHGQLDHTRLTKAVLEAMDIAPEEYARDVSRTEGPGSVRARQALEKLVEYRLYGDLRRSWRVAQPNLEQAGLLVVDFEDWEAFAQDDAHWLGRWREIPAEQRAEWGRAILHHFRRELAIDAQVLSEEAQDDLRRQVEQELRWPWNLSERRTTLTQSAIFVDRVPDRNGRIVRERSYGARSILARYLRHASKWDGQRLDEETYLKLVEDLWQSLRGHYLAEVRASGHLKGWQLKASSLIWRLGSGNPAPPDPVRTRWTPSPRWEQETRQANRYFAQLYQGEATGFQKLEGREHTGQVPGHLRQEREEAFREGQLPVLFCSPTMELGIDISDLSVVHLRNVPPTPTNYAQRSGRAGRGGQAALVVTFAGARNPHDRYFFQRQREMVAGKVIPARFDLYNRDLIQAHIQAMWLAAVGLKVGDHMDEILDLDQHPELPLREEVARQMVLSPAARAALEEQAVHVLQPLLDPSAAPWLTPEWIRCVIEEAPGTFNQAFDRWRTLYRLAWKQRQEADAAVARPARGVSRAQRERNRQWARRQRDNAERELQLLRNEGPDAEESEFYPYRYLASEGFLPGYNFPRIPVRALVQVGGDLHVISRPGFIAVSEFGPHNRVYHEGRQHEVYRIELAAASDDSGSLFQAAKICTICGYWQSDLQADVCEQCGATFAQGGAEYLDRVLAMPTVRTREMWRITANEEDRFRHGYRLTVAYRQIPDTEHREGTVVDAEGKPLMEVRYLAHAELYRINRGWARSREDGFTLDTAKGVWQKSRGEQGGETEEAELEAQPRWERGVQLYVKESRNLLLLHLPEPPRPDPREGDFVLSLAHALVRAIQIHYQLEPNEIGVAVLGEEDRRILLWEASEGGTGTWIRMVEDLLAWPSIARTALSLCHFDATGADLQAGPNGCVRACYECLLGYQNQRDHRLLNRHLLVDYLQRLQAASWVPAVAGRSYDDQYHWLQERLDPQSCEGAVLEALYRAHLRLPERCQLAPEPEVAAEADFYYERVGRPGVCVFVDGPQHDQPVRQAHDQAEREELRSRGYRIVVIRCDMPFAEQFARYADVFTPQG